MAAPSIGVYHPTDQLRNLRVRVRLCKIGVSEFRGDSAAAGAVR